MTAKQWVPRPDHLFVGPYVFEIRWLTNDEWVAQNQDENWGGVTDHSFLYIAIRLGAGVPEVRYQEVLMHEITHAVWSTIGLNHIHDSFDKDVREEEIITLQSPMLLFVLQHNPDIVKYLQSDGTVKR